MISSREFLKNDLRHVRLDWITDPRRRIRPEEPHKVIALHRSGEVLQNLNSVLSARGFKVELFRRMEDLFKADPPDLMSCLLLEHEPEDGICGSDVCSRLRDLGWIIPAVYLSNTWDTRTVVMAMRHGADNFLTKPFKDRVMIEAVEGALLRSRQALSAVRINTLLASLTDCERQVVEMAASGLLNKEIADRLNLALVTVKVYRARAMRKLGAGSAAELGHILAFAAIDRTRVVCRS